ADAFDVPDPEPLADERVDVDAAREHVAPGLRAAQGDVRVTLEPLQRFRRDQRERPPVRRVPVRVEVAVALEALARERANALDSFGQQLMLPGQEDPDDLSLGHAPSLPTVAAEAAAAGCLDRHRLAGIDGSGDLA